MIEVILYSYKNKNLRTVVDSIINNTDDEVVVNVHDQNPIDRSEKFKDVKYTHIFWDSIVSPCEIKGSLIHESAAPYVLVVSDDVILSPNWDIAIKNFVQDRDVLVSGAGVVGANRVSLFNLMPLISKTNEFTLSRYAVREFIFGSKAVWNKFSYPYSLKYSGEQEMLSFNAFKSGIEIYSAPYSLYVDLNVRTLENMYVPFSKEHRYSEALDTIIDDKDFLSLYKIDRDNMRRLPYTNDDVFYRPEELAFQDIDARKFISKTKAIY